MNPVVHFEMPYDDAARAQKFFQDAFGWKTQQFGEEMGNYVTVDTCEVDPTTQRPKQPGAINGGLFPKAVGGTSPSVVVAVDDIQDAMKKVVAAGGKVRGSSKGMDEPDDIPGVGLYMAIEDSEGNRMSLLQPHIP